MPPVDAHQKTRVHSRIRPFVASDRSICTAIETVPRDVTVITISHRPATIRAADRVAVLENGRLVQVGLPSVIGDDDGPLRVLANEGET
ncbi:hypothetical protein [Cellulomonas sp. Marseille-Q8402]